MRRISFQSRRISGSPLQTRDPGLLRDPTAQRHIRETLGVTLNARTVEVHADRLDALLRRLARRDILPRLDLPSKGAPPPQVGEGAEQAAIATALRITAHLADVLGLPTRPAYALARRWSERLPLPLHDAVERTVQRTLEALHRAALRKHLHSSMEHCCTEATNDNAERWLATILHLLD